MVPIQGVYFGVEVVAVGLKGHVVGFHVGLDVRKGELGGNRGYFQLVEEEPWDIGVDLDGSKGLLNVGSRDVEGGGGGEGGIADDVDSGGALGEDEGGRIITSHVEINHKGGSRKSVETAEGDPPFGIVDIKFHLVETDLLIHPELTRQHLTCIVLVVYCYVREGRVS